MLHILILYIVHSIVCYRWALIMGQAPHNRPHHVTAYCNVYCILYILNILLYATVGLWSWGHPVTDHITSLCVYCIFPFCMMYIFHILYTSLYISLYSWALIMGPPGNRPHAFLSLTRSYINTPALYTSSSTINQCFKKSKRTKLKIKTFLLVPWEAQGTVAWLLTVPGSLLRKIFCGTLCQFSFLALAAW